MWASRLAGSGINKWSTVLTQWHPLVHSSRCCGRIQARPKKRSEHDFLDFIAAKWPGRQEPWFELAKSTEWWVSQAEDFANHDAQNLSMTLSGRGWRLEHPGSLYYGTKVRHNLISDVGYGPTQQLV